MRSEAFVAASVLAALLAGCGRAEKPVTGAAKPAAPPARAAVTGSESVATLDALRDTVEARALRGDTLGLARLLVDDSLFRREVFPLSEAYDPGREDVFELVRGLDKMNSVKGLKRLLADARDSSPRALREPLEAKSTPGGGTLHAVPRNAPGAGLRPFGAALCLPGGCRVASYAGAGLAGEEN